MNAERQKQKNHGRKLLAAMERNILEGNSYLFEDTQNENILNEEYGFTFQHNPRNYEN